MKVIAPRFELDECRNDAEREFIETLHIRAEARHWYADGWLRDDRIIVSIDLSDMENNCILGTLRVDFDGATMIAGPDETGQLVSDLDLASDRVISMSDGAPEVLANAAADWLEREAARPIELCEWSGPRFRHRLWRYADTGKGLAWSDTENKKRADLGSPDRNIRVRIRHWPV